MLSLGLFLTLQFTSRSHVDEDYKHFMRMHAMLPNQERFHSDCSSLVNIANYCIGIGATRTKDVIIRFLSSQSKEQYDFNNVDFVFPTEKWCQLLTILPLLFHNPENSCPGIRLGTFYDDIRMIIYRPLIVIFPDTEILASFKESFKNFSWNSFRDKKISLAKKRLTHIEMLEFAREQYLEQYIIDQMYVQIRQQNLPDKN